MGRIFIAIVAAFLVAFGAADARAHFAMLLPSDDIVTMQDEKDISVRAWFLHPFERMVLTMKKPVSFGVRVRGEGTDLLANLTKADIPDGTAYDLSYRIRKPGDHIFHMELAPYWDANEEIFIVQSSKVVINALGRSGGWEEPLGMEVEIVPLTRPYGLWAGNVFQGRVLFRGKPKAGATVEVEHYNAEGSLKAPSTAYITQTVLTDPNGIFTYAIPGKGWWGFAAVFPTDETKAFRNKMYKIERGASFWVHAIEMP